MSFQVYLQKHKDYSGAAFESKVQDLLTQSCSAWPAKKNILIKPNFLTRQNCELACTHPVLIRAVAKYFQDLGNTVCIGDSPGFGSAQAVARHMGLDEYIADLNIPIINFNKSEKVSLFQNQSIAVACSALRADLIVNMPKLKAHGQMRVSGAVKNLFGCVPGIRKAWAHARYGENGYYFQEMFFAILQALPETISIIDGILAMHETGPIHGKPLDFGLLALSKNPVALDTAIYTILQLSPAQVPLWAEASRQNLPGASCRELEFPLLDPQAFGAKAFHVPEQLKPVSFSPLRLFFSALKRGKHRLQSRFR